MNKNQHQDSYQRETVPDKFIFFSKLVRQKSQQGEQNMCMYVSEICAEGIFVTFPWWLKNVKSRSKIALFSNEHYFEIWFPRKKTITFFWSKLSKLHKKDSILHVVTTFYLKQGETRTSHGPIPHPLIHFKLLYLSSENHCLIFLCLHSHAGNLSLIPS